MNEEEMKNAENLQGENNQQGENQPTEMAGTKEVKGMQKMRGRLAEKYPDGGYGESDDEIADKYMSDYDEMDGRMKQRDDADAQFEKLFNDNPQSADFLRSMARGEDFLDNLYKNFGEDIVAAMQDPAKLEELKKANQEYTAKVAKNKELQAEWEANMQESLDNIAQAQDELGMSDEDVNAGMDKLKEVVDAFNSGKISMDIIKMFLKAQSHDADVEAARRDGEIDGRNANINEKMRKRASESDGMPSLGGQSRMSSEGRKMTNTSKRGNAVGSGIWEAGGFKRNQYE